MKEVAVSRRFEKFEDGKAFFTFFVHAKGSSDWAFLTQ